MLTVAGDVSLLDGHMYIYGPNGYPNIMAGNHDTPGYENRGAMLASDESGLIKAGIEISPNLQGIIFTRGSNSNTNVVLTSPIGYPDNGAIYVGDASGTAQAGMQVNASGQGIVYGDAWETQKANPNKNGTNICYSGLEGPEAAAYIRGTGHLIDGKCEIDFPEHFKAVISPNGMTVNLTPLSAASKGLAVTEKGTDHIVIRELHSGAGSYDFDYTVTGIRQGFEDYQVIRSSDEARPANMESTGSFDSPISRLSTTTEGSR
jgi:hypothetical protein